MTTKSTKRTEPSKNTKRGDGRFEATLTLRDGRRLHFYGRTKTEAKEKRDAAKAEQLQGKLPAPGRLTVKQWLTTWMEEVDSQVAPRTATRYREIVEGHLIPRLGRIRLRDLAAADVNRALREISKDRAPRTAHHVRAVLRKALSDAMRQDLLSRNVAGLANPIHVPQRETAPLTSVQAKELLQCFEGDRLEACWLLLVPGGLREGEVLGLRWPDIDFEAGTVSVRRTLQRYGGSWHFQEPKTRGSRRTVPLPTQVMEALKRRRAAQAEERLALGPAWQGEQYGDLVFTNEAGEPLTPWVLLKRFRRLVEKAELPPLRIHDLRHASASMLAALKVPPRVAMELLGHSNIGTTMNVYAHVAPEHGRAAMDEVGAALWAE